MRSDSVLYATPTAAHGYIGSVTSPTGSGMVVSIAPVAGLISSRAGGKNSARHNRCRLLSQAMSSAFATTLPGKLARTVFPSDVRLVRLPNRSLNQRFVPSNAIPLTGADTVPSMLPETSVAVAVAGKADESLPSHIAPPLGTLAEVIWPLEFRPTEIGNVRLGNSVSPQYVKSGSATIR